MRGVVAAVAVSSLLLGCSRSSDAGGGGVQVCGDGIVGAPEVCDGANLGGKDCTTIPGGYVGGTLACAAGCLDFADWRCTLAPGPTCSATGICLRFEATERLLEIETWCLWAGAWEAEGTCPLEDAAPGYCVTPDLSFAGLSIPGATARAYLYAPSFTPASAVNACEALLGGAWSGMGAWTCGDGAVTGMEACDGADVGGATCESLGAASGTLRCAADCLSLDSAGCSTTLSCLRAAAGMCQQAAIPGIPPPGFVASFESSCTGTDPPGTYAAAPCPTADRLGYCDTGGGNWMVFYPPADPILATFICSLSGGTWVSP